MPHEIRSILFFAVAIFIAAYLARGRARNAHEISTKDWIIYISFGVLVVLGAIALAERGHR